MIVKITKGTGFRGAVDYVAGKPLSRRVGGTMAGETPRQLAAEAGFFQRLRPALKKKSFTSLCLCIPTRKRRPMRSGTRSVRTSWRRWDSTTLPTFLTGIQTPGTLTSTSWDSESQRTARRLATQMTIDALRRQLEISSGGLDSVPSRRRGKATGEAA